MPNCSPRVFLWRRTLVAPDESGVADSGDARAAELIGCRFGRLIRLQLYAEARVPTLDVRQAQGELPVGIGAVPESEREIAMERAVLDLAAAECRNRGLVDDLRRRRRMRAVAQLILIDIVVFEIDPPSGAHRVAHGPVGTERAAP